MDLLPLMAKSTPMQLLTMSPRLRLAAYFALQSLRATRQRALLALIGITIGVAAVVALLSIGKSAERKTLQEFEAMGTQVISVSLAGSWGDQKEKAVSNEHIIDAIGKLPDVDLWSEVFSVNCEQTEKSMRGNSLQLMAVRPHLQRILGLKLMQGRFLHALDSNQKWVVLGARAHQQLLLQGHDLSAGQWLNICGQSMQIAGSLAPSAQADGSIIPFALDEALLISPAAAQRIEPSSRIDTVVMLLSTKVSPISYAQYLVPHLEALIGKTVAITTAQKIIQLRQQQAATYSRFLAALASISLLVGGLGILNIMLIAVVERRREIGIRLALGADDRDIAYQFLIESILLGAAGGVVGIVLGIVLSAIACGLVDLPYAVALGSIPLTLALSMLIGTLSGLYPAMQAAKLDPIETLQGT